MLCVLSNHMRVNRVDTAHVVISNPHAIIDFTSTLFGTGVGIIKIIPFFCVCHVGLMRASLN